MNKKVVLLCFFAMFFQAAFAYTQNSQTFPESFCTFREAVYAQNTNMLELMRRYTQAKQDIERTFTGVDLYTSLSRCEYLMGLSFQIEGKKNEAAAFYEQGIALAEESLGRQPTSEGYRLLGTNISLLCGVRRSYALSNFGAEKPVAFRCGLPGQGFFRPGYSLFIKCGGFILFSFNLERKAHKVLTTGKGCI